MLDPQAYLSAGWQDVPGWQLYLVPFEDDSGENSDDGVTLPALEVVGTALRAANASVLSFLPPSSLLAAISPGAAADLPLNGIQLVGDLALAAAVCVSRTSDAARRGTVPFGYANSHAHDPRRPRDFAHRFFMGQSTAATPP